ncbi:hypothetical protein [Azospirillum sp. sgz301742]
MDRHGLKGTPRWVAVHESGHAVASWAMQRALGLRGCHFERVVVRSMEEAEAGAYVTGLGCRIDCLGMVEEPARYLPQGRYLPGTTSDAASPAEYGRMLAGWRRDMEADVVELLAGTLAEARCRRISRNRIMMAGGSGDYALALRKARDFARNDRELNVLMTALWARAAAVLRPPPRWAAVEALADALLERRVIEGADACAIIEHAVQTCRPGAPMRGLPK